jgi:hypothetical protein
MVPIHGTKDSCLLVHVTPESASQPLKLTLRATEGEERASTASCDAFAMSPTVVGVCVNLRDSWRSRRKPPNV